MTGLELGTLIECDIFTAIVVREDLLLICESESPDWLREGSTIEMLPRGPHTWAVKAVWCGGHFGAVELRLLLGAEHCRSDPSAVFAFAPLLARRRPWPRLPPPTGPPGVPPSGLVGATHLASAPVLC